MIIEQGGMHLQVCAELIRREVPPHVVTTFSNACRVAKNGGQGVFRASVAIPAHQYPPSESLRAHFSLRRSSPLLDMNQYSTFSLSSKLNHMHVAERLDLAYKVVESGLLLLDTPWLSALGSNTITRLKISGKIPKYFLGIQGGIQDCVQQRLPNGLDRVHIHIFAIGVLLVELALCTIVSDVEMHQYVVCLVQTKSRIRRLCSRQGAVRQVREQWGYIYAEAVQFCLQDPSMAPNHTWDEVVHDPIASEKEVSEALLGLFYKNVFLK